MKSLPKKELLLRQLCEIAESTLYDRDARLLALLLADKLHQSCSSFEKNKKND